MGDTPESRWMHLKVGIHMWLIFSRELKEIGGGKN